MALVGLVRVSTSKQETARQHDALDPICERVFEEKISGSLALDARPALSAAIDYMRSGDMLTVQEVDRLGRNLLEGLLVLNDLFSARHRGQGPRRHRRRRAHRTQPRSSTSRSPWPRTAAATSSARPATGSPPPAPAAAPAADPASSTPTSAASSSPATPTANPSAPSPAPPRCPSAPSTTSSPTNAAAAPDHRWSAISARSSADTTATPPHPPRGVRRSRLSPQRAQRLRHHLSSVGTVGTAQQRRISRKHRERPCHRPGELRPPGRCARRRAQRSWTYRSSPQQRSP